MVEELSKEGVPVVVGVDPVISFVNDDPERLARLVNEVTSAGAKLIVVSTLKLDRSSCVMDGSPTKPSWKTALSEALRKWGGEGLEAGSELTTWMVDGQPCCACYVFRPARIRKPGRAST